MRQNVDSANFLLQSREDQEAKQTLIVLRGAQIFYPKHHNQLVCSQPWRIKTSVHTGQEPEERSQKIVTFRLRNYGRRAMSI